MTGQKAANKIAYRLSEAAEMVSVSQTTLRQAIKATDPKLHLPAKKIGSDYRIGHDALVRWFESRPDA